MSYIPAQSIIDEFTPLARSSYEEYMRNDPDDQHMSDPKSKEVFIDTMTKLKMAHEIIDLRKEVSYLKELNRQMLGHDRHQDVKA